MKKSDLLDKLAQRRAKLADHVSRWALPKEQLFPIDTADLVKMAASAFADQAGDMSPSQRLVASRNICARADELGVHIESSLAYKYASSRLSDHFSQNLELRKQATAHLDDELLDKLLKVAHVFNTDSDINNRVRGLDKVASALEAFDRDHNLAGHWGHWFADPAYSTYGMTADPDEVVVEVVKVADMHVSRDQLEDADWSRIKDKVVPEVYEGMVSADDKLAVFSSLPAPEKEIICQTLFVE